ncbi:MAG: tetratricopeptide repeat protein [Deltaproteobacteria bacterium]
MKKNKKRPPQKVIKQKNQAFFKYKFLLIPVIAFTVFFLSVFNHEFINFDDVWMIYENIFVTDFSAENLKSLFSSFYFGQYSPLAMSITMLAYQIGSGSVMILKLGGIIIHILNIILVYFIFNRLIKNEKWAIFITVFFAFHPVQVESVVWLSAVYKIGIFSFFTLLGLLSWLKFRESEKIIFYILSIFSMVLACFSKEQALVFPLYLLLINFFQGDNFLNKKQIATIPFFVISLIFVWVTFNAAQSRTEVLINNYSIVERAFFLCFSFLSYLKLIFLPFDLEPFYLFPQNPIGFSKYLIFLSLTLIVVAFMFYSGRKDKRIALGYLFFIISVLATFAIQIASVRDTLYADRYLYLGVPAIIFAFLFSLEILIKVDLKYLLLFLSIILTGLTIQRIGVFKNSETLWTDSINKNHKNYFSLNNRGHYYRQKNLIDKALQDYNEALKMKPDYYLSLNNRGKIYFDQGQLENAMQDYNKCLKIAPNYAVALSNRGAAHGAIGQVDYAIKDLNRALELEPNNYDALSNRGFAYYQKGEYAKTISDYKHFLELKPDNADIINTIGLCYLQLKDPEKAFIHLRKAISLEPEKGAFYLNMSLAYFQKSNWIKALEFARQAQSKGMNVEQGYIRQLEAKQ